MSSLFKTRYGLTEIQISLTFIANGVGSMVGTLVTGKILDKDYRRVKAKYEDTLDIERRTRHEEDFTLEQARLRLMPVFPSEMSAAASASLNFARFLFAAGGTSFIMPMINGVGVGVAFTICAVVQAVALIGPSIQYKCSAGWRRKDREKAEQRDGEGKIEK
ncbi:hypothetical protein TSTA_025520 [Talaromyces stipitatus ATCC 10500]|uniref:Uncharacterized protein n=1 Tax=Talaromyces stipitatus (strain ATCC 10500 / CBS 375.48 / QM 6759 / NRRL 1006) TaxID=441959 RepID=B8M4P0_TALSN|nr:uncharacterized protein TSTA_025520 [Talaromyces stipitatus ATCC 10500]EED19235.1 hypothetical protein TSTA_025520 [Talaromyces stipitatus ATCC 10500]